MRDNLIITGQDKDPSQVIAWLFAIDKPETTFESLEAVEPGFGTLDRRLAVALRAKLPPNLSQRLRTMEMADPPKMAIGRQILFMAYQYLAMASLHASVFSLKALIDFRWLGDSRKEAFRNEWNSALARTGAQEASTVMKTELFLTALGASPCTLR